MHRSLIKIGTFFLLLTFDQERGRVETKLILIAGIYNICHCMYYTRYMQFISTDC